MPILTSQPDNINFLSPLGYRFVLKRAPNVVYFVTDITLPSVTLGSVYVPTPFKSIPFPGDHLVHGDLRLTFRIDEDMANYFEIHDWLVGLGKPDSFSQYSALSSQPKGSDKTVVSDATLFVLNSAMEPNIQVDFEDIFPIEIGEIAMTSTDIDVNYITNTVTFKYKTMNIIKL